MQRNFVCCCTLESGFAQVVERRGQLVGGLCGVMTENHYGIPCAVDLLSMSKGGTELLLRAFVKWAKDREAAFVQITDMGGLDRYQRLLRDLGWQHAGQNFVRVL
jgi:hypothetical protein